MIVFVVVFAIARTRAQHGVSWELTDVPAGANAQWRVYWWLREHRAAIQRVERERQIDRIAIAGVIAYESLENVHPAFVQVTARYSGPGKVHYKETHIPFIEGDPVAKQVETLGYVPRVLMAHRRAVLATDDGAITYIAAIMAAFDDVANAHHLTIRCRPDLLATMFSAWELHGANRRFGETNRVLRPNGVGEWVFAERRYLASAVGETTIRGASCNSPRRLPFGYPHNGFR